MLNGPYKILETEQLKTEKELDKANIGKEREDFLIDKSNLIFEIFQYINSFSWLKRAGTIEKIKFFIDSGYDYPLLCKEFGISDSTARNCVSWSYKKLRDRIGENTVSLIQQDRIEDARLSFDMAIGKIQPKDLLVSDFIKVIPKEKFHAGISLEDCRTELKIMQYYSAYRLEDLYKRSDGEKMEYILHLLVGTSKKADLFRKYLVDMLKGNMSVDELISLEDDILKGKIN